MELITNIDVIRIPLVAGQRIYYLPYKRRNIVPQKILYSEETNYNYTYKGALYLTLTDENGTYITKDFDMHNSVVQRDSQGALRIGRQINFNTSYVRIPESQTFTPGNMIYLYVVYSEEGKAQANGKILTVTFNGSNEQQRLSDYITGYQGNILRIEFSYGSGNGTTDDGVIILNDAYGRGITAPLEMFAEAMTRERIYNPYNFKPISPVWQNSKIYVPNGHSVELNFIFAK